MDEQTLEGVRAACKILLKQQMKPMHYAELTRRALQIVNLSFDDIGFRKWADELREKVFTAGLDGFVYVGKPHHLVVLSSWFETDWLFNTDVDAIRIDVTSELATEAAREAALRVPHMVNKFNDSPEAQAERVARGLLIEKAVSGWFRSTFPTLWRPPDNDGDYKCWCGHDFKLKLRNQTWLCDVAGSHRDGLYGVANGGKPNGAHIHILADDCSLTVNIKGFRYGNEFRGERFAAESSRSIVRLVFFLHCQAMNLNYTKLKKLCGYAKAA